MTSLWRANPPDASAIWGISRLARWPVLILVEWPNGMTYICRWGIGRRKKFCLPLWPPGVTILPGLHLRQSIELVLAFVEFFGDHMEEEHLGSRLGPRPAARYHRPAALLSPAACCWPLAVVLATLIGTRLPASRPCTTGALSCQDRMSQNHEGVEKRPG